MRVVEYLLKPVGEFRRFTSEQLRADECFTGHWNFLRRFKEVGSTPSFKYTLTGKSISTVLGEKYQKSLKQLCDGSKGAADICAFFVRRAWTLCIPQGFIGLIATKSWLLCQGDSREVSYEYLLRLEARFTWALHRRTVAWRGERDGERVLCLSKASWQGDVFLNGRKVDSINSRLCEGQESPAFALRMNKGRCSDGIKIQGDGFILTPEEREQLVSQDPQNTAVISPYLIGDDITSGRAVTNRNWIIDFRYHGS